MTALYHYETEADIARIADGFLGCTLPKAEWTHGAHWAAAFWVMRNRPDIEPERDMPDLIRRYNESTGGENTDTAGYHVTITQASLRVARAFLAQADYGITTVELCNRLFASPYGRSDWLLDYWSRDVLFSVRARREWVAPDLKPLALT